jgi:hypothetical protein
MNLFLKFDKQATDVSNAHKITLAIETPMPFILSALAKLSCA